MIIMNTYKPDRVTVNGLFQILAPLGPVFGEKLTIDEYSSGKVALWTMGKNNGLKNRLSEYMTKNEMYFYIMGLYNMARYLNLTNR